MAWFAEAERVHCRWAMLGVAGVLAQELVAPTQFWYTSSSELQLPFNLAGLVAFQLFTMHWVESKRGYDILKPGSQDQDPVFGGNKLPAHAPGYPGGPFAPFVPGDLEELKLKEIKNGRLAMLAFIGFVMAAQVTGLNPLAALGQHLADPMNTTIFSKAVIVPGMAVQPACMIPESVVVQGVTIPAGAFCLLGLCPLPARAPRIRCRRPHRPPPRPLSQAASSTRSGPERARARRLVFFSGGARECARVTARARARRRPVCLSGARPRRLIPLM